MPDEEVILTLTHYHLYWRPVTYMFFFLISEYLVDNELSEIFVTFEAHVKIISKETCQITEREGEQNKIQTIPRNPS